MKAPKGYLDKDGAAKCLGCQPRTIDNLMKRRAIVFLKFGRRVLFKESDLIAALEGSRVTANKPEGEYAYDVNCWMHVLGLLRVIEEKSQDEKERNLAREAHKFIMKFDV